MNGDHLHMIENPEAVHPLDEARVDRRNAAKHLGQRRIDSGDGLRRDDSHLRELPPIRIKGRVGWSCAENMMSGTVIIEKNAGSTFGAALRGGDLVCMGDVGARVGIDMKGGTILIGGRAGAFCGFMMQRGRMVILGDAGKNLGDSMYDGTIYVGGKIEGLGVDAVPGEMTDLDISWLTRKLKMYGLTAPNGVKNIKKIVAGRQLWNYDNLEPAEKKLIL